jgi:hypothetical protein
MLPPAAQKPVAAGPGVASGARPRPGGPAVRPDAVRPGSGRRGAGRAHRFGSRWCCPLLARLGRGGGLQVVVPGDAAFDDDVGRPADHDQMLDIIAPDQHEPAACVDRGGIEHGQARLAVLAAADEGRGGAVADQPEDPDECQKCHGNDDDGGQQSCTLAAQKIVRHPVSSCLSPDLVMKSGLFSGSDRDQNVFDLFCTRSTSGARVLSNMV